MQYLFFGLLAGGSSSSKGKTRVQAGRGAGWLYVVCVCG